MADDEFTDTDTDDEGEGHQADDSAVIRELRAKAREADKLRAQAAEADALRRDLAFARAGIDTTTKVGAMFAKSFDGDLTDLDGLKAEALEHGVGFMPGYEPAGSTPDTGTGDRRALADGSPADTGVNEDPKSSTLADARKKIDEGAAFDQAAGHMIHKRALAAMQGDRRVLLEPGTR